MGLRPDELHALTMADFTLMYLAYLEAEERKAERSRRIVEAIVNCAGFGAKKWVSKEELWPLNMDDRDRNQPIVNRQMAYRLLDGF